MAKLNEIDPSLNMTSEMEMKVVIPPHLMMKTCATCPDNCRGCFGGIDSTPFCYECAHGFLLDLETDECKLDPSWSTTDSAVKVSANRRRIAQCDEFKIRIDQEEGYDMTGLHNIKWSIEALNVDLTLELI